MKNCHLGADMFQYWRERSYPRNISTFRHVVNGVPTHDLRISFLKKIELSEDLLG